MLIKKKQSGFSMIEVMISLAIIGFGLLSLAGMQLASLKTTNNAHSLNVATILAMELSDRMHANPIGARAGDYENLVDCSTVVEDCSDRFCTPLETAKIDVQEVKCGKLTSGLREGGVANSLPAGLLVIDHGDDCDPNIVNTNETSITISWNNNSTHKSQTTTAELEQSMTTCVIP